MSTVTTSVQSLLTSLRQVEQKTNEDWMNSLNSRKRAELEFHDDWRDRKSQQAPGDTYELIQSNTKYYSTVERSRKYVEGWLEQHVKRRVFLDYACGNGDQAIRAAKAGAALAIGLDISNVSIENAKRSAEEEGVAENTYFVQGDCENTGLPKESVEVVLCSGMLHHLDLSYAFPELRRIMKPGAVCLALEALDYNPLIKLYRWLTPSLRTEWEKRHILSLTDIRFARRFFEVKDIKYWHLNSVFVTALRKTPLFEFALTVANGIDAIALKYFPISLMAWMFSFELHKRDENGLDTL